MVLAQQAVDDKTNEIPVARTLLEQLTLEGVIVSADALHTHKATTEQIVAKGGTTCCP
jgi:predicted transposase YbfD/YdcC